MAEIIGIIGSSIAIANTAATLSRVLFDITETLKNARSEIADIAQTLSLLSGTLHFLADVLNTQQHLCKPTLFQNTRDIIGQYKQVDVELRKLIENPNQLARLTWHIKKAKVKSLLQRLEAIKTSLTLVLNVIQLAREEVIRPLVDSNSTNQSAPQPNFRELVETAVQANRQVVESAQREDADYSEPKPDLNKAEVDFYREGSFDTATWLYHLVFDTRGSENIPRSHPLHHLRYQASVTDESGENAVVSARLPFESGSAQSVSTGFTEKAMIVWGRKTEPASVVDRLLSSWTILTQGQIEESSTRQKGNEWRRSVNKMVDEVNEKWNTEYNYGDSDVMETSSSDELSSQPAKYDGRQTYTRPTDLPHQTHKWSPQHKSSRPSGAKREPDGKQTKRGQTRTARTHEAWDVDSWAQPTPTLPGPVPVASQYVGSQGSHSASKQNTSYGQSAYRAHTNPFAPPRSSNPFVQGGQLDQGHVQSSLQPAQTSHFPAVNPLEAQWPYMAPVEREVTMVAPHQITPTPNNMGEESAALTTSAKENEVLAVVTRLIKGENLQKSHTDDPRFVQLLQLLTTQQEQHAQMEVDRAKATAKAEMELMLAARDKDYAKTQRLEHLIMQQSEEQQSLHASWRAERIALDENTAKQAREAKELAEREIAAARSAKKAAQKSLKFAKAEAERRLKEEADAKAKEERKKNDKKSTEKLQHYERLLETAIADRSVLARADNQPLHRTCITDGNCTLEVAEYTTNRTTSYASSELMASAFFQNSVPRSRPDERSNNSPLRLGPGHHNRRGSTLASTKSSPKATGNTSLVKDTNEEQQLILFPSKLDRASAQTSETQSLLMKLGISVEFEDAHLDARNIFSQTEDLDKEIVRSSLFWEAPSLSLGSELLNTYKRSGWRPAYARSSDSGRTYFLGSEPIHTYFFRPDYRPQFSSTKACTDGESIIIDKALIHEYALIELGHAFRSMETGSYILDGRLHYNDIEALIERSFLMRESHFRAAHRQLGWHRELISENVDAEGSEQSQRSATPRSSMSEAGTYTSCAGSEPLEQDGGTASQRMNSKDNIFVEDFLEPPSEDENLPPLCRATTSSASPSVVSWSSKSSNPFRKHMNIAREKLDQDKGSELFPQTVG